MTTPLPPHEPPAGNEKLPGEDALSALYRELSPREPSAALDAAVLGAAARALAEDEQARSSVTERRKSPREPGDWVHPKSEPHAAHSHTPRRARRPRWLIPVSSAAAVVLVAGVAWRMHGLAPDEPKPAPASDDTTMTTATAVPQVEAGRGSAPAAKPLSAPPPARQARAAAVAPAPAVLSAAADYVAPNRPADTPAQELDRIAQLFAQGHDSLARERLAAFVQAHPQWDLPPELREKLRQP